MTDKIGRRKRPCAECPWRTDTPPGQFGPDAYQRLAPTSGTRGAEADLDAPLFACHKSQHGQEIACAGWLAAVGHDHLGIRLAVITGRLPASALTPGEDWPELYESLQDMAAAQAADHDTDTD